MLAAHIKDKRLQSENAMRLGICSCKVSGEKWPDISRGKF